MDVGHFLGQTAVVLSCEHGGNKIPREYLHLFADAAEVLNSHRGWDPGALELFNAMKKGGVDYAQYDETTRLLIDLNRSLHRRTLFSEFSGSLSREEKTRVIEQYYLPFRERFMKEVEALLVKSDFVFHVSVHSFTPVLKGTTRNADVGLLFNPTFGRERKLAYLWRDLIRAFMPGFRVRMNYPYLGKTDGHVAALRSRLGPDRYAGIELEMNQSFAGDKEVINLLASSFRELIARF